jgi:hypothetical protein
MKRINNHYKVKEQTFVIFTIFQLHRLKMQFDDMVLNFKYMYIDFE